MKHLIFKLLPTFLQRRIILKKTGSLLLEANVSDKNKFKMYIVPNSPLWKKRLETAYGHEPKITRFYEEKLTGNDVIFDIGAQMGYFPSLIPTINKNVSVYAFEASWYTYSFLLRNKQLNDSANTWKTYNYFISDENKTVKGETFITINSLLSNINELPTVFQMDVDGEEYRIIKGAANLLDNGVTEFLIEVHPKDLKERGITTDEFLGLFDKTKYVFRYLPDLRNNKSDWIADLSKVNMSEEFYLYAAPINKNRIHVS